MLLENSGFRQNLLEIHAFPGARPLAFTLAPHLQLINYRGRFSRFGGI